MIFEARRALRRVTRLKLHFEMQHRSKREIVNQTNKVFGSSAIAKPLPPTRRILIVRDLPAKGVSYHINHLRRLWKQDLFPKPFYPTKRRCSWFEEDIDQWLLSKQAEQQAIDKRRSE